MKLATNPWIVAGVAGITGKRRRVGGPTGSFFNALAFDFHVGGTQGVDTFIGTFSVTASAFLTDPASMVGPIASMLETGQVSRSQLAGMMSATSSSTWRACSEASH